MSFPVTLNGTTYTLADFSGTSYVDGFPAALEDFVTHAGAIYSTTSTTSNVIGTGSKTFTVEASKPYQVGTPLRIADTAAVTTNWIDAIVTSYSGTSLVVTAVAYAGSGTKTAWSINIGGGPVAYTGTLPVAQGGTGGTSATAAASNLGVGTEDSPTFSDATLLTSDGGVLNLQTSEATIVDGDVLGALKFNAPSEADGADGDARLVGAEIAAVAEGTFSDTNNATELVFKTGASAAANAKMTLTSGGNLLVGMTSANTNNDGAGIRSDGLIHAKRADVVATFNRKTSDGNIVELAKDNTVVGSIGYISSGLYIDGEGGHAGLRFGGADISPRDGGADADNAIQLGSSSNRFSDLYLSGGVYLGGTGAANKLDDYEEGTWTPTVSTGSLSGTGTYVKVGKLVSVFLNCQVTTGGATQISGLPFNTAGNYGFSPYVSTQDIPSGQNLITFVTNGSALLIRSIGDNTAFSTTALTTGTYIHSSFVYQTS